MQSAAQTRLETEVAPGSVDQIACADLIRTLFGGDIAARCESTLSLWHQSAVFTEDGRCIAALQTTPLRWIIEGVAVGFAAIRLVGVAEDWRGCGFCRTLVELAVAANAGRGLDLNLLFSSEPALYSRLGFVPVTQHAFRGPMPDDAMLHQTSSLARPIDPRGRDRGLFERLSASRAPVSRRFHVPDAETLFLDRVYTDPDLCFAFIPDLDAIIVYEVEPDTFVLIDVVAAAIPSLHRILSAFPRRTSKVKVLFWPDQLDWAGEEISEDNGLMAHGDLPRIFDRPFIVPPTAEF